MYIECHAVSSAQRVSLDDPLLLTSAREESSTFLKDHSTPLFIDEIQYVPQLFPQIKIILDKGRKKGQFYLSGSQQFQMMKNVSESLMARDVGISQPTVERWLSVLVSSNIFKTPYGTERAPRLIKVPTR